MHKMHKTPYVSYGIKNYNTRTMNRSTFNFRCGQFQVIEDSGQETALERAAKSKRRARLLRSVRNKVTAPSSAGYNWVARTGETRIDS